VIDEAWARRELESRETDELVEILAARDVEEWRPEIFPIVEQLLRERGLEPDRAVAEHRRTPAGGEPLRLDEPEVNRPVVLLELEDEVEAGLCHRALLGAGIEAVLHDPDGSRFQLLVDASREEAARAVLEAAEAEPEAEGDLRCPSCGFIAEPIEEEGRLVCQVCGEPS